MEAIHKGCLLMQSYFSAIGVLCMVTMVRELWWLAMAEMPVALATLAIACRAICCIEDQPQSVTSIAYSGKMVPLQHEDDPKHLSVNKQVLPSAPPREDPAVKV